MYNVSFVDKVISTVDCKIILQQTEKNWNLNTCRFFLPCSVCNFCYYIIPLVSLFKLLPNRKLEVEIKAVLCFLGFIYSVFRKKTPFDPGIIQAFLFHITKYAAMHSSFR